MLCIQIAPLVFSKSAVFCFEEVYRYLVASVEVKCPAIVLGDAIVVEVCLILDLDRCIEQDFSVRADAGVMSECRLRRDGGVVC